MSWVRFSVRGVSLAPGSTVGRPLVLTDEGFQIVRTFAYASGSRFSKGKAPYLDRYINFKNIAFNSWHTGTYIVAPDRFFSLDSTVRSLSGAECREMIVDLMNIPRDLIPAIEEYEGNIALARAWDRLLEMIGQVAMSDHLALSIEWDAR